MKQVTIRYWQEKPSKWVLKTLAELGIKNEDVIPIEDLSKWINLLLEKGFNIMVKNYDRFSGEGLYLWFDTGGFVL